MSGVEYKVLELMRFINEDMVDAHLLEVNDCILVLAWMGEITLEEACEKIKPEADAILDKMNAK